MQKSESIKNIAKALLTFHVKVETIKKDAANPFFKSKYASLSNILDGINQPLIESGMSFVQFPNGENGLITLLMHGESGEFIQCEYSMTPIKNDPQSRGSSITYQRRYALSSILGLNIDDDDDDDGNAATKQPSKPTTPIVNPLLMEAVKKLENCKTVDELKHLKETLDTSISESAYFKIEGKKRYDTIISSTKAA